MNEVQLRTEQQLSFVRAQEQACGVTALYERIAAANEAVARCERVLHETMEYREVEAIKERRADAKREAVAGDANVADAKDALTVARSKMKDTAAGPLKAYRAAKGAVKALKAARDEAADGVVKALAGGGM